MARARWRSGWSSGSFQAIGWSKKRSTTWRSWPRVRRWRSATSRWPRGSARTCRSKAPWRWGAKQLSRMRRHEHGQTELARGVLEDTEVLQRDAHAAAALVRAIDQPRDAALEDGAGAHGGADHIVDRARVRARLAAQRHRLDR